MRHIFVHLLILIDKFSYEVELIHSLWLSQSNISLSLIRKGFFLYRSLGYLHAIRIWHDNTGGGSSSSWFLKYLIIRDLQTMEKFHFISQRWFAVEKDDGKVS